MTGPSAVTLQSYTGTLILDDPDKVASLRWSTITGDAQQIVMMLDPSPTGGFDPAEVFAAWNYFSNKPGVYEGSIITVVGLVAVPPGANQPFLHVVRA